MTLTIEIFFYYLYIEMVALFVYKENPKKNNMHLTNRQKYVSINMI